MPPDSRSEPRLSTAPRRGTPAYVAGRPGFYVVNPSTNIAVGGYSDKLGAEAHIAMVEAQYPHDHAKMLIVEVPPDA